MLSVISNSVILGLAMSILQKWIGKLFKISPPGMGINTRLLPVVTFSLTPPQQVKLSPIQGRRGDNHIHFASKSSRISRQRTNEHFHQNEQLRGKVRRVDLHCGYEECHHQCSCGTFNFNIHNAQTCWLRGLSDTHVFCSWKRIVSSTEKFRRTWIGR